MSGQWGSPATPWGDTAWTWEGDALVEVISGPHVYYPEGRMGTTWVLAFTATGPTDTLNWQVWTDPNRSGVMVGSGTCQKDTPTAVRFDGNVPVGQTSTLYLSVDDDL